MLAEHKRVLAVVGATASGKSALGEALALRFNGEIISADSRQVYRSLDLGTGKEKLPVTQHCIDIADPGERVTVVDWKRQAESAISDIHKRGKVPIVVGGSGLYVDALLDNFSFAPEDETGEVRSELETLTTEALQERLRGVDPASAIASTNNRRHLVRALEREALGERPNKQPSPYEWLVLGVELERDVLYKRIDQRVDSRMKQGMLEEVEGLLKSGVSAVWLRSLGLEYRYLTDYIEGRFDSREIALEKLKFATHHFARRQLIWWRRRTDIVWVTTANQAIERAASFLHS